MQCLQSVILEGIDAHGQALHLVRELRSHGEVIHAPLHELGIVLVGFGLGDGHHMNVEWSQPESLLLANMGRT